MSTQDLQPNPPLDSKVYIFQLESVIRRCFEEAKKAGWIVQKDVIEGPGWVTASFLVNEWELSKHISKTVIGELHELELIRRLSPVFRAIKQLSHEFEEIDSQVAAESRRLNLRKEPNE